MLNVCFCSVRGFSLYQIFLNPSVIELWTKLGSNPRSIRDRTHNPAGIEPRNHLGSNPRSSYCKYNPDYAVVWTKLMQDPAGIEPQTIPCPCLRAV